MHLELNPRSAQSNDKHAMFVKKAVQAAARSSLKVHRHGCVIVKDGVIVSGGYNYHTKHVNNRFTIHAEMDALVRLKKSIRPQDCDMYVVRIGRDSIHNPPLKYSRPCADCMRALQKAGIKRIYFLTNDA